MEVAGNGQFLRAMCVPLIRAFGPVSVWMTKATGEVTCGSETL